MLRGFYIAASGMVTNQRSLNAVANNISNANTASIRGIRFSAQHSMSNSF